MRERESTRHHKKCDEILKDLRMGERRGAGRRKLSRERGERSESKSRFRSPIFAFDFLVTLFCLYFPLFKLDLKKKHTERSEQIEIIQGEARRSWSTVSYSLPLPLSGGGRQDDDDYINDDRAMTSFVFFFCFYVDDDEAEETDNPIDSLFFHLNFC